MRLHSWVVADGHDGRRELGTIPEQRRHRIAAVVAARLGIRALDVCVACREVLADKVVELHIGQGEPVSDDAALGVARDLLELREPAGEDLRLELRRLRLRGRLASAAVASRVPWLVVAY